MDCAPLAVLDGDVLRDALSALFLGLLAGAAVGAFAGHVAFQAARWAWRVYRMRGASRPFSERAAALERARLRSFLLLDRIAARNARERARHA